VLRNGRLTKAADAYAFGIMSESPPELTGAGGLCTTACEGELELLLINCLLLCCAAAAVWEVFMNKTAFTGCHSGAVVERVVLRGERPGALPCMPAEHDTACLTFIACLDLCWRPFHAHGAPHTAFACRRAAARA
jgi:hypothetical protein